MATLSEWKSAGLLKVLLLGNSGAGKTGSLASLAAAGYNVRVLDLENKLGVLRNVLTAPGSPYPSDAIGRISAITLSEPKKLAGGKVTISAPKMWSGAINTLAEWKDDKENLGPVTSWTSREVLVIDTLSALSKAALRQVLAMNGRLNQRPWEADWGSAQDLVEDFVEMVTSPELPCHVIVLAHIIYLAPKGEAMDKGFPQTLGKALSPKIGRSFDATILAQSSGVGQATRRKIITNNVALVELKSVAPLNVKPEYELSTGLAEYFRDSNAAGLTPGTTAALPKSAAA